MIFQFLFNTFKIFIKYKNKTNYRFSSRFLKNSSVSSHVFGALIGQIFSNSKRRRCEDIHFFWKTKATRRSKRGSYIFVSLKENLTWINPPIIVAIIMKNLPKISSSTAKANPQPACQKVRRKYDPSVVAVLHSV